MVCSSSLRSLEFSNRIDIIFARAAEEFFRFLFCDQIPLRNLSDSGDYYVCKVQVTAGNAATRGESDLRILDVLSTGRFPNEEIVENN
mmetsp:Transcript_3690/g.10761  ORF Transcript_3690/g.10761 Transcript_3690/m.10761 type:complete len:88 (-) Transcript_3690:72-335(-)